jgi:Lrp/AsnC family transcriptional regulator for asnA, asnC and gidA
MDEKDEKIIEMLLKDGRATTNDISKKTGIPQTTVHNRIKRLVEDGTIGRFTIELDNLKMGRNILAFIFCTVEYKVDGRKIDQEEVATKLLIFPEVLEASIVTGETDIILKAGFRDVEHLNEFIIKRLRKIEGIEKTRTSVVMKVVG